MGSRNIDRKESTWIRDHLGPFPTYPLKSLRRRFRVPRDMFYELLKYLTLAFPNVWGVRRDAAGRRGIRPKIKLLACLQVLGTAISFNEMDDGYIMAPGTLRKCFKFFRLSTLNTLFSRLFNPYFSLRKSLYRNRDGSPLPQFFFCHDEVIVQLLH